jgi:hypothetical protein
MKALILASFLILIFASTPTLAGACYHKMGVPTATCSTYVTKSPLPQYVCCEKLNRKGHAIWRDTWVSGGCGSVAGASYDFGCTVDSPVYGTGEPIKASCLFSYSTGLYR